MPDSNIAYRPAEAAAVLGISRSTLYNLLSAGELESFKLGKSTLIPRQTLEDFVERKQREQKSAAA